MTEPANARSLPPPNDIRSDTDAGLTDDAECLTLQRADD